MDNSVRVNNRLEYATHYWEDPQRAPSLNINLENVKNITGPLVVFGASGQPKPPLSDKKPESKIENKEKNYFSVFKIFRIASMILAAIGLIFGFASIPAIIFGYVGFNAALKIIKVITKEYENNENVNLLDLIGKCGRIFMQYFSPLFERFTKLPEIQGSYDSKVAQVNEVGQLVTDMLPEKLQSISERVTQYAGKANAAYNLLNEISPKKPDSAEGIKADRGISA